MLTLTVTGVVGPGNALTATVISNIVSFTVDCVNNVISYLTLGNQRQDIGITSAATITATKSGSTYTLTIS